MNKRENMWFLILILMPNFMIVKAQTFTIKHDNCSSAPLSYKIIRAKTPIKIVNYTFKSEKINIESGVLKPFSEKQIKLNNSKGKVQVIITTNLTKNAKEYINEYFFNQKVFCVINEKKICYLMPEEFFNSVRANKTTSPTFITLCPDNIDTPKQISKPYPHLEDVHMNKDLATLGGTALNPIYESQI